MDLLGLEVDTPPRLALSAGLQPASKPEEADPLFKAVASSSVNAVEVPAEPAIEAESGVKRFVVRCEGRWRVRSAPSLNSKVLGTVASGTVIIAKEATTEGFEGGSGSLNLVASTVAALGLAGGAVASSTYHNSADKATCDIGSLWVEIVRLEAQEAQGVSEIRRDIGSGGILYCLRRNALGYGLYESGVESQEGPLSMLPEALAMELRADAQRASTDRSEDLSLTWRLLEAAESVSRLFTSMSSMSGRVDEGGVSEDIPIDDGRRPEDLFEMKQRENLKKAAASLRKTVQKITSKATASMSREDVTVGLPKDVARRFAKLRSSLDAAAEAKGVDAKPKQAGLGSLSPSKEEAVEGSQQDLQRFADLCLRLERTGGWPELQGDLKQEVIQFNQKYNTVLDDYARTIAKVFAASPSASSTGGSARVGLRSPHSSTADVSPKALSPTTPDLLFGDVSPPSRSGTGTSSPFVGVALLPPPAPTAGVALLPPPPAPASSLNRKV